MLALCVTGISLSTLPFSEASLLSANEGGGLSELDSSVCKRIILKLFLAKSNKMLLLEFDKELKSRLNKFKKLAQG